MKNLLNSSLERVKKKQLTYIHTFRGLSILFIVANHMIWITGDFLATKNVLRNIVLDTTLFFLIISGYLFEHLSYKYKHSLFLRSKFRNVLLPYIVCSIPIIAFLVWNSPDNNLLLQVGRYLLTGEHLGPFWYIPVLIGIFLLSPLIILVKNYKVFDYTLILTLGITLLLPVNFIPSYFYSILHYFGYFHLGIVMAKHRYIIENLIYNRRFLYAISILVVAGLVAQSLFLLPYLFSSITKVGMAFMLLAVAANLKSVTLIKLLGVIANYSFGIYFIHQYFINVFAAFASKLGVDFTSLVYTAFVYPIVIFSCMLIIYLSKKIVGKYSRSLIGA